MNMKLREQRESKLTMASPFFSSSHIFSINKEFGSVWKYCKWDQNLAEEVSKVQNKQWTTLHQKSRTVKENNKLFISNIRQHNKSYYSFLYFFFFALLLYMIWIFWKPDTKLGSCSKHVETEQVVPMGISWKLLVLLSPWWTLHCRGKYTTTLHEQQIGRYILSISVSWQIEKSWKDMKKSPYYIIGYVLMGDLIHIPCIYMQTVLQMLKAKRKK